MDGLVPPALRNPIETLDSRIAESVPIKDMEEHVIVEFAGGHAWGITASFFFFVALQLSERWQWKWTADLHFSVSFCVSCGEKCGEVQTGS
jgi:hypothetical protein